MRLAPEDLDALNNLAWLLYERREEKTGGETNAAADLALGNALADGERSVEARTALTRAAETGDEATRRQAEAALTALAALAPAPEPLVDDL